MTDDAITMGFAWLSDRNETAEAIGAGQTDFADPQQVLDIMVAWVNANGGVNGRELVPYYRPYTQAEWSDPAFGETLCTEFTEDNDLYAAVLNDYTELLVACLADGGVPAFNARPVSVLDGQRLDELRGFVYHTSGLDLTQNAVLTAQGNVALGHLTPDSTLGVITIDQPSYRRGADVFAAELGQHGIAVADTVYIDGTSADAGSAQIANAVLRFRQLGVDRVAVLEINGVIWWAFTLAAEGQAYRPDYVLNPTSYAEFFAQSGLMATEQMAGSKGVATQLTLFVNRASEPHPPEGRGICRAILDAAGMPAGTEDNEGTQMIYCDMLRLVNAGLDRATDLSPAGLQAAIESLGRTFAPAQSFGSYYGPGFHTGAGTYYTLEYVADCNCFRMTSDILNMPGTPG